MVCLPVTPEIHLRKFKASLINQFAACLPPKTLIRPVALNFTHQSSRGGEMSSPEGLEAVRWARCLKLDVAAPPTAYSVAAADCRGLRLAVCIDSSFAIRRFLRPKIKASNTDTTEQSV